MSLMWAFIMMKPQPNNSGYLSCFLSKIITNAIIPESQNLKLKMTFKEKERRKEGGREGRVAADPGDALSMLGRWRQDGQEFKASLSCALRQDDIVIQAD